MEETAPDIPDLTDEVTITEPIPAFSGTYSFVFKGTYRGETVAIKIVRPVSNELHTMLRKLRRELDVWGHLDHQNIVRLYGYTQANRSFGELGALISPWHRNGDAEKFLKTTGSCWDLKQRTQLWLGTVAGVSYLHEHDPVIIHGDLKPSNILIGDDGIPKLCDFGLVRIFMEEGHSELTTTSPYTGTERYLAPELFTQGAVPTTPSDVYALGCIGLEFLFSQRPYAHHQFYRPGIIAMDVMAGVPPANRPEGASVEEDTLWDLLSSCWKMVSSERPGATRLAEEIIDMSDEGEPKLVEQLTPNREHDIDACDYMIISSSDGRSDILLTNHRTKNRQTDRPLQLSSYDSRTRRVKPSLIYQPIQSSESEASRLNIVAAQQTTEGVDSINMAISSPPVRDQRYGLNNLINFFSRVKVPKALPTEALTVRDSTTQPILSLEWVFRPLDPVIYHALTSAPRQYLVGRSLSPLATELRFPDPRQLLEQRLRKYQWHATLHADGSEQSPPWRGVISVGGPQFGMLSFGISGWHYSKDEVEEEAADIALKWLDEYGYR